MSQRLSSFRRNRKQVLLQTCAAMGFFGKMGAAGAFIGTRPLRWDFEAHDAGAAICAVVARKRKDAFDMNFAANRTALAAALALTASVGLTLPASADAYSHNGSHHRHHVSAASHAYRVGYRHGFRDGHIAAAEGPVATGRSAYVAPAPVAAGDDGGLLGGGGLLGTGVLGGNGVLGTGVLDGQGALGIGVLGF